MTSATQPQPVPEALRLPVAQPAPPSEIDIDIPFPALADLKLVMAVGACQLKTTPGEADPWVAGMYINPKNALPPKVEIHHNVARISQEMAGAEWWNLFGSQPPSFDLRLGKAHSYALTVETGASDCTLELGGLPLSELKIRQGAGKFALDFSIANPIPMRQLSVEGGAASLEMCCLANANFAEMTVNGGAASYALNFAGKLHQDAVVRINAGVSSVAIEVPATTAVRITTQTTIGSVEVGDGFTKQEGAFCTPVALTGGKPLLTIQASVALGSIQLRMV
jgi:hypothetical protein